MAIINSELLMLKSVVVTETAANGGRMDNNESVTTNVPNNVWPSAFEAERVAGGTKYRKTFFKVANDDDETLYNPRIWMDVVTPGDDWQVFYAGSQTDTQGTAGAGITGTDAHGCAGLHTNVVATGVTLVVDVEDASLAPGGADNIFRSGDKIRITNKDTPSSATGTEEYGIINGTPTVANQTEVTITLTTGLLSDYNTSDNTYGTRVMTVYEPNDVVGSYDSFVVTTAGDGDFDDTTYPISLDNIGTIEQEVTMTFTSPTVFTAASDVAGVTMTGGTVTGGQTWSPDNPDVSKDYFIFDYDGFSGTWAADDTIVFKTHPASFSIWQKRVIPAGADSLAGDKAVYALNGESV